MRKTIVPAALALAGAMAPSAAAGTLYLESHGPRIACTSGSLCHTSVFQPLADAPGGTSANSVVIRPKYNQAVTMNGADTHFAEFTAPSHIHGHPISSMRGISFRPKFRLSPNMGIRWSALICRTGGSGNVCENGNPTTLTQSPHFPTTPQTFSLPVRACAADADTACAIPERLRVGMRYLGSAGTPNPYFSNSHVTAQRVYWEAYDSTPPSVQMSVLGGAEALATYLSAGDQEPTQFNADDAADGILGLRADQPTDNTLVNAASEALTVERRVTTATGDPAVDGAGNPLFAGFDGRTGPAAHGTRLNLPDGVYRVTFSAADVFNDDGAAARGVVQRTISFDSGGPVVSAVPAGPFTAASAPTAVQVAISDPLRSGYSSGVDKQTVQVFANGIPIGAAKPPADAKGAGTYSVPLAAPLSPGSHALTVTVADRAGNITSKAEAGTIVVDGKAPAISKFVTPAAGLTDVDAKATIETTVEDGESGLDRALMYLDGKYVAAAGSTGTLSYTPDQDLAGGLHTVRVEAWDEAGNGSEFTWTFTTKGSDGGGGDPGPGGFEASMSPASAKLGAALSKGVRAKVTCSAACGGTVTVKIASALAKRLKIKATVGSATIALGEAGETTLVLRFKAAVRKKLKRMKSLRLSFKGFAIDDAGTEAPLSGSLTLRR